MYKDEEEFKSTIQRLKNLLMPSAIDEISSLITSLYRQNEDLRKSRDLWRNKFKQLH